MKPTYKKWLEERRYQKGTVKTQINRAKKVEECYGDLDGHYENDRLQSIISELKYSKEDERQNKPNPSKIRFRGNIRNNLASYRNATERYRKFRDEESGGGNSEVESEKITGNGRLIGLERDMQVALRSSIEQLEPGLEIIDDGAERPVSSGFIDITAKDADGEIVVIELKTGTARQRAVAQILSYMGDVAEEEEDITIRGILVAADFDTKARSAARMVPTLSLRSYRVNFEFADADETPGT